MNPDKPADYEDKKRNMKELFDRFQDKAENLKSVLDQRRMANEMVDTCLMCMCFPCILCATCVDYFCSHEKKN
jgi:hypothetical protein